MALNEKPVKHEHFIKVLKHLLFALNDGNNVVFRFNSSAG